MVPPPKKVNTKKISRLPQLYIMESGSVSKIITTRCRFFRSIWERFLKYISFKTIQKIEVNFKLGMSKWNYHLFFWLFNNFKGINIGNFNFSLLSLLTACVWNSDVSIILRSLKICYLISEISALSFYKFNEIHIGAELIFIF